MQENETDTALLDNRLHNMIQFDVDEKFFIGMDCFAVFPWLQNRWRPLYTPE